MFGPNCRSWQPARLTPLPSGQRRAISCRSCRTVAAAVIDLGVTSDLLSTPAQPAGTAQIPLLSRSGQIVAVRRRQVDMVEPEVADIKPARLHVVGGLEALNQG